MTFDLTKAKYMPVTLEQFLGRGYDFEAGELVSERTAELLGCGESTFSDAYAEAFSAAAHGISLSNPKVSAKCIEWFSYLNEELLGGLTQDLLVTQWSTDWSSWFDPGNEYWGSFMWSVRPPKRDWTVVIAQSTTD